MSENRESKEKTVEEIREDIDTHDTFLLVDFEKMPVSKSAELRKKLRESSYSFRVVKNRLALRAIKSEIPEEVRENFKGATGIAFAQENPIGLARLIKEFSTQNKLLKVKGGIVEGMYLTTEKFNEIAALTSKRDLLAKIGYLMAAPMTTFLRTWQAPFSNLGSMLSQLKSKK